MTERRFVPLRRMIGDAARKEHLTGHGWLALIEPVSNGYKPRKRKLCPRELADVASRAGHEKLHP